MNELVAGIKAQIDVDKNMSAVRHPRVDNHTASHQLRSLASSWVA